MHMSNLSTKSRNLEKKEGRKEENKKKNATNFNNEDNAESGICGILNKFVY